MFINIEDKMFSGNNNNNNSNAQGGVNKTAPVNGIKASEGDAKFVGPAYGWDGMNGKDQSVSGDSHHSEDDLDQISAELQVLTEELDAEIQALDNKDLDAQKGVKKPQKSAWTEDVSNWDDDSSIASSNASDNVAELSDFDDTPVEVIEEERKLSTNYPSHLNPFVTAIPASQVSPTDGGRLQLNNLNNDRNAHVFSNGIYVSQVVIEKVNELDATLHADKKGSLAQKNDDSDNEPEANNKKGWKEALAEQEEVVKQKLAKWVGADPNKKFSEWSSKQQIHACGKVGGLLIAGAPLVVAGAGIIGIGAVVLGGMFGVGYLVSGGLGAIGLAGIKTVQGFNWTAKKTIEGTKIAAGKIASAYAAADQKVRKATSDGLRSVANRLEKWAGRTNHPQELADFEKTTKELFNKAVAVLQNKVLENPAFSEEEKKAIVAATMGKMASVLDLKVIAAEETVRDPKATKYEREEAQELFEQWTKQKNFVSDLNFKKLGNLLDGEYKSAPRDLNLFMTTLADHHGEVESAVNEKVQEFLEYKQERANADSNAQGKPRLFGLFKSKPKAEAKPTAVVKPLNAASNEKGKPKLFRWFTSKPKAGEKPSVDGGYSTQTSSTTLDSKDSPMSKNGKVRFNEDKQHHRAQSLGDLAAHNGGSTPLRSVSDGVLNKGSAAARTLVIQAEVHKQPPVVKPAVSADSGIQSQEGSPVHVPKPDLSEISQNRLRTTGFRDALVHNGQPQSFVTGTSGNVNQHLTTVVPPIRTWAIEV